MAKKTKKSDHCQNCNQTLSGENYCPNCSQLNDVRKPTLWSFITESLSNFFALDNKFLITVYTLFRYPGRLAKDYSAGKKVKYMPPIRIYFISSILLLFFINLNSGSDSPEEPRPLSESIFNNQQTEEAADTVATDDEDVSFELNFSESENATNVGEMFSYASKHQDLAVDDALDSLGMKKVWINREIYNLGLKLAGMDDDEFDRYISPKIFWILFLFLPLFTIWLKLFYIRKKRYYLEHMFFAFYTQSAFFLLFGFGSLLDFFLDTGIISTLSIPLFGIYLFIALKTYYQQGVFKTMLKFIFLNTAFFFSALAFSAISLLVSFILY
jgi:hypothetical protein